MKIFFVLCLILLCMLLVDSKVTNRIPKRHIKHLGKKIATKQCGNDKICKKRALENILKTERKFRRDALRKCKCHRSLCRAKCLLKACEDRAKKGCLGNNSCANKLKNTCVLFHLPSLRVKSIKKINTRKYNKIVEKRANQVCNKSKDKSACTKNFIEKRTTSDKKLLQKVRSACTRPCKRNYRCKSRLNKCIRKQLKKSCSSRAVKNCANAKNKSKCTKKETRSCKKLIRKARTHHRRHRRHHKRIRRHRRHHKRSSRNKKT